MKRLTAKEEEIMGWFWQKGPLFVKELLEYYEEPKPHFNTLSTIVRGLEEKGFLAHKNFGNSYQYYAVLTEKEYSNGTLKNVFEVTDETGNVIDTLPRLKDAKAKYAEI